MRRVVSAALAAGLAVGVAAVAAPPKPALRLTAFQPLKISGRHFVARERVRLKLSGVATATRRAVATRTGSFAVTFAGVGATRCDVIRVVATGSRGSRAVLKYLPAPGCLPE